MRNTFHHRAANMVFAILVMVIMGTVLSVSPGSDVKHHAEALSIVQPPDLAKEVYSVLSAFGPPLVTTREQMGEMIIAAPFAMTQQGGPMGCKDVGSDAPDTATEKRTSWSNTQEFVGKIVLAPRGSCTFRQKVSQAQRHGAIGVVIVDRPPSPQEQQQYMQYGTPKDQQVSLTLLQDDGFGNEITIPTELISYEEGMRLMMALGKDNRRIVAQMGIHLPTQNTAYY